MFKKVLIYLILCFISINLFAQVPEGINYQAVVRNTEGELIISSEINFKISILEGSITGNPEFVETQLKQTSEQGVSNLVIGEGTNISGSLAAIDWGSSTYYLKIEADIAGGDSFVPVGTVQLYSVPYALYAKDVANKDDMDADPSNEIQNLDINGDTLFIENGNNVVFSYDSSLWRLNESELYYTAGKVGIGTSLPNSTLEVKAGATTAVDDTLFMVKDKDGKVVFAVFNDGVKVYVNEGSKGNVGGFAVSGRGTGKATEYNVLNVTPDSARFYLNDGTKGTPGGFAVSGRGTGKTVINDYLQITPDSTRIYINDNGTKGTPGGFAVSGRGTGKANYDDYFNVSGAGSTNTDSINPSEPRMLWYPKSEAFLVGRVLIEDADSVGLNSMATGFESRAIGDYSQAMGYQSVTRGDYSTAIGRQARADSINSFAFGNYSLALGEGSYAIGSGAVALGENSFALGSVGVDSLLNLKDSPKALGDYSFAMGLGTKSTNIGSISIGANNISTGGFATALGFTSTANGYGSTAIGFRCETSESGILAFAGGVGSVANERGAVSFGSYCEANGPNSVAIGERCTTAGTGSVAMGKGTHALATGAIALGLGSVADGVRSFALGAGAFTNGKEGAFVVNAADQSADKVTVHAIRDGQVVFVAGGGYNFYASNDTAEASAFVIQPSTGNIGIGTFNPDVSNKLEISGGNLSMLGKTSINLNDGGDINIKDGSINLEGTAGIFVNGNPVTLSDYVFEADYELESIEEHAEFMWREKHLPALKGIKDIEREGGRINILERREKILEELEKAHIYIEQLNERIKALEEKNKLLEENLDLKKRIEELEKITSK